ncbi:helix-turn-helix domain-containing protein [Changpingibacter yushuensis]|uniref:helix-turn-helix domain-containing protein n=1 Tax=Changpingibacter yushuensis TaxID=2758440 RepID=UPI00165E1494|nr:helix-turn-helix domain-containing protein [Changpingibacter yushuensis]
MPQVLSGRGVLYPTRLPTFQRVAAPAELADLIRWFWIPRWDIPPGRSSRQHVLSFPASNLVVEPNGVTLQGPTTRVSYRDLRGKGWAVGALLRPAAVVSLCDEPSGIRDSTITIDAPELHGAAISAMQSEGETDTADHAAAAFASWAEARLTPADEGGLLANAIEDLIASDSEIVRIDQIAKLINITARHVQRVTHRYVGVPPLAIIRRYRLQDAAERIREGSSLTIGQVAADLGYADHAHLTRDFRQVLGLAPVDYRRGLRADAQSDAIELRLAP